MSKFSKIFQNFSKIFLKIWSKISKNVKIVKILISCQDWVKKIMKSNQRSSQEQEQEQQQLNGTS